MREIKFRAWDTVGEKFLMPWPDGFHILGETTCFDLIGMQLKERSPDKNTLAMLNDVVIEQFTGLQDKNGKDIYEGDIARFYACPEEDLFFFGTAEMVWSEPCFVWKPIECLNEFGFEFLDSTCFWNDDFETIGSIHENPELLK